MKQLYVNAEIEVLLNKPLEKDGVLSVGGYEFKSEGNINIPLDWEKNYYYVDKDDRRKIQIVCVNLDVECFDNLRSLTIGQLSNIENIIEFYYEVYNPTYNKDSNDNSCTLKLISFEFYNHHENIEISIKNEVIEKFNTNLNLKKVYQCSQGSKIKVFEGSEVECLEFCKNHGWTLTDENEFEWELEII